MLSRASHIDDIRAPSIESLAEATQAAAGEFYQVLSERIQAQYPITTGLLPWVYKRPWPVIAIQTVDGFGQPTAPYDFLKRTYELTHIAIQLPSLLYTPGKSLPLDIDFIHAADRPLRQGMVYARILGRSFKLLHESKGGVSHPVGVGVERYSLGAWTIPESLAGKFFFLVAELKDGAGKLVSRAAYWPRCRAVLADEKARKEWRKSPAPWPTLETGPWLKPQVVATRTRRSATILRRAIQGKDRATDALRIESNGTVPAFYTSIPVHGRRNTSYASDHFFWLEPGESREMEVHLLWRESASQPLLRISAWNGDTVSLRLTLCRVHWKPPLPEPERLARHGAQR